MSAENVNVSGSSLSDVSVWHFMLLFFSREIMCKKLTQQNVVKSRVEVKVNCFFNAFASATCFIVPSIIKIPSSTLNQHILPGSYGGTMLITFLFHNKIFFLISQSYFFTNWRWSWLKNGKEFTKVFSKNFLQKLHIGIKKSQNFVIFEETEIRSDAQWFPSRLLCLSVICQ